MSGIRELKTVAEFARMCGVSQPTAHKHATQLRFDCVIHNKRKMVDMSSPKTQEYLAIKNLKNTPEKGFTSAVTMSQNLPAAYVDPVENENPFADDIVGTGLDWEARKQIAETLKAERAAELAEIKNAKARAELMDIDVINELFVFLNRLKSEVLRLGDTELMDILREAMTEDGGLKPHHFERWNTTITRTFHNVKEDMQKHLKREARKQAGGM